MKWVWSPGFSWTSCKHDHRRHGWNMVQNRTPLISVDRIEGCWKETWHISTLTKVAQSLPDFISKIIFLPKIRILFTFPSLISMQLKDNIPNAVNSLCVDNSYGPYHQELWWTNPRVLLCIIQHWKNQIKNSSVISHLAKTNPIEEVTQAFRSLFMIRYHLSRLVVTHRKQDGCCHKWPAPSVWVALSVHWSDSNPKIGINPKEILNATCSFGCS